MTSSPLVETDWLAGHLADPKLALFDASWFMPGSPRDPDAEYVEGHIPGALRFDIDALSDPHSDLPHMLARPEEFGEAMGRLGLDSRSTVVVYDSVGLFSAPRAWWTFRAMGHGETYVLNGGLPRWKTERRPLESSARAPSHGRFEANLDRDLVRDLADMRTLVREGLTQIIDARSAPRFSGEAPEPREGLRGGHMPGAINVPWSTLVREDALRESDELRRAFEQAGVDLAAPIVTTCGSGVSASLLSLALARLGRFDVPVYDGSWTEWGSHADTPIVTGP